MGTPRRKDDGGNEDREWHYGLPYAGIIRIRY